MKNKGVRAIAVLEGFKGSVSLLVGFGLHALAGRDIHQLAESLVRHFHLNPASHLSSVFLNAASDLTDSRMVLLALAAFGYSVIRFIEAFGLWRGLVWTEWFALVSGAIYIPFEVYEIITHTSFFNVGIFLINVLVVWYMSYVLFSRRKQHVKH